MGRILGILLLVAAAGCTVSEDGKGGGDVDAGAAGEPDAGAAAACAGGTAYMDSCSDGDQCDSCLCFTYNMGAALCTHACQSDADCAAPSTGCSGMGVCKRPNG